MLLSEYSASSDTKDFFFLFFFAVGEKGVLKKPQHITFGEYWETQGILEEIFYFGQLAEFFTLKEPD